LTAKYVFNCKVLLNSLLLGQSLMKPTASHGQILKSSSIMGGTTGLVMLLSMMRLKFAALLIGTSGVGLIATYTAIQDFISNVAGMGIQSSAVREIATAVSARDEKAVARLVTTLRRICWLTGMVGMLVMVALSPVLSQLTFGNREYAQDIAALGLVVLMTTLANGQLALLQGMRHIGHVALTNAIGAFFGALIAVGFYYWLGIRGVIPALVSISAIRMGTAWYFARRISVAKIELTWLQTFHEAIPMIKLGLVVMWTALMVSGTTYLSVVLITHEFDLNAVGLYSASFTLSGVSVSLVLGAMAADYYPRLTSIANDKGVMNRLVNEQTEVALLLAAPGLIAGIALAPWVLQIFYATEFMAASSPLQWFLLGGLGRVISFPLGFVILALGKARWYLLTETSTNFAHIATIIIGLEWFGVTGVAIAFLIMSVIHIVIVFLVSRHLTGFGWSSGCLRIMGYTVVASLTTFIACQVLAVWTAALFGVMLTLAISVFSVRELARLVGPEHPLIKMLSDIPIVRGLVRKT
jgi:enterobacterial common antigen flippase